MSYMPIGIYDRAKAKNNKGIFQKGHLISEEIKNKISRSLKGNIPWNKDKINCYSKETRKKMSISRKGIHLSEETKKRMGEARKGHLVLKETREKLSKANKGQIPWSKGKIMTKEFIRKTLHGRNINSLEKKFQEIINKNDLPYKFVGDGSFILNGYNPDFINTNGEKIAIEVYAKYFKQISNMTIDGWKNKRVKRFKKYGWDIIFFEKNQVKEENVLKILNNKKEMIENAISLSR